MKVIYLAIEYLVCRYFLQQNHLKIFQNDDERQKVVKYLFQIFKLVCLFLINILDHTHKFYDNSAEKFIKPFYLGRDPTYATHGQCRGAETKMLSEQQWTWFENELHHQSEIKVIASGIQVLPPTDQTRSQLSPAQLKLVNV